MEIKEYCWPLSYVSVPKWNVVNLIQINVLASNSTCKYGHIDTLNSKIRPLLTILLQNWEEQEH